MAAPKIHGQWVHPVLQVTNLQETIDFYTQKLGFTVGFRYGEPPTTAGLNLGEAQILAAESPNASPPCHIYFVLQGLNALYEYQRNAGVTITEEPADKPWGLREYTVEDPWGNTIGFGQHVPSKEPKLQIERRDVPVRLESRLASLLEDLAAYKHMTVSECLEEIILHSFEKTAKGATASPHTSETFDLLEELKAKHGIDYETHASYRFYEKVG